MSLLQAQPRPDGEVMPTLDMALFDWTDYEDLKPEVWPSAKKKGTSAQPSTPTPGFSLTPLTVCHGGGPSEPSLTYRCPEWEGVASKLALTPTRQRLFSSADHTANVFLYQLVLPEKTKQNKTVRPILLLSPF